MTAVADKHIIDLLRQRDGLVTLVKMKSGVTYRVYNIAWGYDMGDSYAHVTSNISPSLPETQVDFFSTQEIDTVTDVNGEILSTKARHVFIDGNNFSDLLGFYDEVERKLTHDMDWNMGRNLDAFNDVLRGGFGVHECGEELDLTWLHFEKSKLDLGYEETLKYVEAKLTTCHPTNVPYVQKDLEDLKSGKGDFLFQIIVGIIREHDHVKLRLQ